MVEVLTLWLAVIAIFVIPHFPARMAALLALVMFLILREHWPLAVDAMRGAMR